MAEMRLNHSKRFLHFGLKLFKFLLEVFISSFLCSIRSTSLPRPTNGSSSRATIRTAPSSSSSATASTTANKSLRSNAGNLHSILLRTSSTPRSESWCSSVRYSSFLRRECGMTLGSSGRSGKGNHSGFSLDFGRPTRSTLHPIGDCRHRFRLRRTPRPLWQPSSPSSRWTASPTSCSRYTNCLCYGTLARTSSASFLHLRGLISEP